MPPYDTEESRAKGGASAKFRTIPAPARRCYAEAMSTLSAFSRSLPFALGLSIAMSVVACSKHATDASSDAGASAAPSASTATGTSFVPAKYAHPCQILTRADAEKVLGSKDLREKETTETVTNGVPSDVGCVWSVTGGGGFAEIHIHVPTKKDRFDKVTAFTPERTVVGNVGDKAYLETKTKWGHVDVLKGDQTFFVQVESGNSAFGHGAQAIQSMHEATVDLARILANRM